VGLILTLGAYPLLPQNLCYYHRLFWRPFYCGNGGEYPYHGLFLGSIAAMPRDWCRLLAKSFTLPALGAGACGDSTGHGRPFAGMVGDVEKCLQGWLGMYTAHVGMVGDGNKCPSPCSSLALKPEGTNMWIREFPVTEAARLWHWRTRFVWLPISDHQWFLVWVKVLLSYQTLS